MPNTPQATWLSLLANKRRELAEKMEAALAVDSERNFRAEFERICDVHSQTRTQRYLGNFQNQFKPIKAFTGGIDSAGKLTAPDSLTSLFWAFVFTAIATALDRGIKLKDFATTLKRLSESVPNFGAGLARHFNVEKVQKPLQDLFSEYLDCYMTMIFHFNTSPQSERRSAIPEECNIFELIKSRFDTAIAIFVASKQEWDQALLEANAAEEARRSLAYVPSVLNGLDDQSLRSHTTSLVFKPRKILGHGTYGQVSEVQEPTTGLLYACKLIRPQPTTWSQSIIETQVKSEVDVMQKLHHPHIASVLISVRDSEGFKIIMLPVANYNLLHFLEIECPNNTSDTVKQLDAWFGCLVMALAYAHNSKIKHRDIKPANILIKDGSPYLSDFGSAKDFSNMEGSTSTGELITGTPVYYAPEKPPWGRAADVFALGCVFSEMLTVRCGRALHEYRDFRRATSGESAFAFRENLPTVGKWLANLEPTLSEPLKLVYRQTLKMLEADRELRCEAKDVRRKFRSEAAVDTLFCNSCC
jgi:hypothetical protein